MSVNTNFRKRLLEQRKIERKRSLSKKKGGVCQVRAWKKQQMRRLGASPMRNSSSDKIRPRPGKSSPSLPFSREANQAPKPSSTSCQFYKNSLYNTPSTTTKQPFDYFNEDDPKKEIQAFSKYCDSIMKGLSDPPCSVSLSHLPPSKPKVSQKPKFRTQKSVQTTEGVKSEKRVQDYLLSQKKGFKESQDVENGKDSNPDAIEGFSNCYIRFSSKGSDKNISIKNSFCIEHL